MVLMWRMSQMGMQCPRRMACVGITEVRCYKACKIWTLSSVACVFSEDIFTEEDSMAFIPGAMRMGLSFRSIQTAVQTGGRDGYSGQITKQNHVPRRTWYLYRRRHQIRLYFKKNGKKTLMLKRSSLHNESHWTASAFAAIRASDELFFVGTAPYLLHVAVGVLVLRLQSGKFPRPTSSRGSSLRSLPVSFPKQTRHSRVACADVVILRCNHP
ncbi:uncharacterized protein EV422DRAFT_519679 [Fimicolochytrium jonesii]|uniref:uncharacterized protein n=1 Tax=Fimicolochytrium jonesii TaxID=1396493 RepID=UPI0022FE56D3|nr:uncharacterized protein EV422DRAFT_519679 [Fimicolochytrium jonesii]KAI8824308.1 hypothetical protein EV422DRAFT_519679 [Fimicolochytrium jonesii]